MELAVMNLDGSGRQVLTDNRQDIRYPRVTPTGRILYVTRTVSGGDLKIMEADGNDPQTLAAIQGQYQTPALSPHGNWVVIPKTSGLWRLRIDGTELTQLTDLPGHLPTISPDGTRVAFYFFDDEGFKIGVIPSVGGELEVALNAPAHTSFAASILRWARDGEALIINTLTGDRGNLWRFSLDGGEPQRMTDFTNESLFWFEYTPDGETLVVASGERLRDAVLIRNFR